MSESTISGVSKTNIAYTGLIFLNHFIFGISSTVIWPTLVDLGHIYNDPNGIFLTATFASTGYTLGSLSGFLYKWLNRQLTVSFMLLLTALSLILMPYYPSLIILFVAITVNGIGGGTWDSNNNVWLAEIWKERGNTVLQFSQFLYGVGTIVGPIIVSPYVHGDNTSNHTWTPEARQHDLLTPFAISGITQSLVPIIFLILFIVHRYQKPKTVTNYEVASTEETAENEGPAVIPRRLTKILLMGLCLAAYGTVEISYFYFASTMLQYLEITPKFSAQEAAHLMSILSAAYTIGRLITVFISMKLSPGVIIVYHYAIVSVSFVLLYVGRAERSIIYGGMVLLGYGFSAMWPAILAFTAKHLRLTDRSGAFIFFLDGASCVVAPFLIGPYIESYAPSLYIILGIYLFISISLFTVLRILIAIK